MRYFAHAICATFAVVLAPALVVTALRLAGHVDSSLVGLAIGAALSLTFASAGSRMWARRPRDIVFSDLMLWGFLRRLRTERRLAETKGMLGLTGEGAALAPHVVGQQAVKALESLGAALEARDAYTHGHTQRVARHSHMIARAMGLSEEQVGKVRTAAAVHDVGKISTPREVINKTGKLTEEEYEVMKRHAIVGAAMAARISDPEITAMVRHHHEQLDGSGYPDGLGGSDIPLGARIIAVADTFDAITSARPYRPAQQHKRAMRILRRQAGTQLDPRAVEAFLGYYSGRRSVAGWSMIAAAPQKLGALLGSLLHTTGAASISQGVAAFGAAAAIAGGAPEAAVKQARDSHRAHGAGSAAARVQPASYAVPTGGVLAPEEQLVAPETLPVDARPVRGEQPRRDQAQPKSGAGGPVLRDTPEAQPAAPDTPKKDRAAPSDSPSSPGAGKKEPEPPVNDSPPRPGNGNAGAPPGQAKPKPPAAVPAPAPVPVPTLDPGKAPKLKK
jgi:putative nucleotidyltransferase with HDIG domain